MRINLNYIYCVKRGKPLSFIGESRMKELKQCCLRHVAGGAVAVQPSKTSTKAKPYIGGKICCDLCYEAGFEDALPETYNRISRESFSSTVGDIGGVTVGILTGYSGINIISGTAISYGASKVFGKIGEYIYDNPDVAKHPDYP